MLIHYLLFIFMMISFLIIFAKPTPVSSSTPHSIVPYSEEYLPFYEMITYKPLRYQEELAFLKTKMSTSSQVLDDRSIKNRKSTDRGRLTSKFVLFCIKRPSSP